MIPALLFAGFLLFQFHFGGLMDIHVQGSALIFRRPKEPAALALLQRVMMHPATGQMFRIDVERINVHLPFIGIIQIQIEVAHFPAMQMQGSGLHGQ